MMFTLHEPMQRALPRLRSEFLRSGLAIAMEWDAAADIRSQFGVELAPCRVLTVYCPVMLLELQVVDPTAAATQPVRLSLTERDGQTYLHLVSVSMPTRPSYLFLSDDSRTVEGRIVQVLRSMGARQVPQETAA